MFPDDPSHFKREEAFEFLDFIRKRQETDPDDIFEFKYWIDRKGNLRKVGEGTTRGTKRLRGSRSTAENESDVDSDLQDATPSEATSSGKGSAEQEQPNDRRLLADQSGLEGDDESVRMDGQEVLRQSKDHDHQIHKDGLTQNHGPTKKGKQRQCTPAPCRPSEQEGSNDEALPADQSGLQADRSNGKQSKGKQKETQKEMVRQSEDDARGVDGPAQIHRPISKGKQRQCTPAPRQILRTATEGRGWGISVC